MVEVQPAGGVKRHRRFTEEDLERIRTMAAAVAAPKSEDGIARGFRLERTKQLALMASLGLHEEDPKIPGTTLGWSRGCRVVEVERRERRQANSLLDRERVCVELLRESVS